MNRTLYTLLFHLGLPLVAIRLWLRARKAPAYAKRIGPPQEFWRLQSFDLKRLVEAVNIAS